MTVRRTFFWQKRAAGGIQHIARIQFGLSMQVRFRFELSIQFIAGFGKMLGADSFHIIEIKRTVKY